MTPEGIIYSHYRIVPQEVTQNNDKDSWSRIISGPKHLMLGQLRCLNGLAPWKWSEHKVLRA